MVTTPKSSSNHHSPTHAPSSAPSGEINSPNLMRKPFPSPWAKVVRGGNTETTTNQSAPSSSSSLSSLTTCTVADQPLSSDSSPKAISTVDNSNTLSIIDSSDGNGNAGRSKKPAWKKPPNGSVVGTGPLLGTKWPALSLNTNKEKMPAEESSSTTDADGSLSTSQGPAPSHSPQKQGTGSNAKSNSAPNYNVPNRQRPMRRVGGSNTGPGPVQSNFSNPPPPPPPPFPIYSVPSISYGNVVPSIPNASPRDHYRNNNWDARPLVRGFVPAMNERVSYRRGNMGSHPRDGSHHNRRGNYANTRDVHEPQPRMLPRGFLRHPIPSAAAFVGPQPIGRFPSPTAAAYSELYYFPTVTMDPYSGMPLLPHSPSPAAFFPIAEATTLSNMIINQIDYYFSDANLVKDAFLRSNMDEQGWVPITLIANFPRVKSLTNNIQLILDSMRNSTVVEIQGDKLRKREWMK